MPKTKLGKTKV